MKQIIAVLVVILLITDLVIGQQAQQTTAQPSVQNQISQDEAKKLQESLSLLRQALGIEKPTPAGQTAPQQPQKSMADVLDKLLDMMKTTVASLSEAMKKVAPEVWRIMVKQQYAKAFSNLVVPWGLFIIALNYTLITKKVWKMPDEPRWKPFDDAFTSRDARAIVTSFVPFMLGLIFSIWGVANLKDSILYLVNPQYYALRDLFMLLLNPGAM